MCCLSHASALHTKSSGPGGHVSLWPFPHCPSCLSLSLHKPFLCGQAPFHLTAFLLETLLEQHSSGRPSPVGNSQASPVPSMARPLLSLHQLAFPYLSAGQRAMTFIFLLAVFPEANQGLRTGRAVEKYCDRKIEFAAIWARPLT